MAHSLLNAAITTEPIPPRLAISIQDCASCSCYFQVGTSDLDQWVVRIEILPKGLSFEDDLGPSFQLRQIDSRITWYGNAVKRDGRAS